MEVKLRSIICVLFENALEPLKRQVQAAALSHDLRVNVDDLRCLIEFPSPPVRCGLQAKIAPNFAYKGNKLISYEQWSLLIESSASSHLV
jgi:hypothetical protein